VSAKKVSNVECKDVARTTICCCMLIIKYMEQQATHLMDCKEMDRTNQRFCNFKTYDYPTRGAVRKEKE